MNCLELFSGTHSFGKCAEALGHNVISLDIDGRATITKDILEWDYTIYPKDYFDIIWASPPCNEYSCMNYCRPEKVCDIEGSDKLVLKTLEIINYFNPELWYIENPQTSLLKSRPFMKDIPYVDVDYCMFGWYIRKRTRIWTNKQHPTVLCDKKCGAYKDGKHLSFSKLNIKGMNRLDLRHTIPPELIYSLLLNY